VKLIQQMREFLGFQPVGDLGEVSDIGEEHGELLALAGELDLLAARKDRVVRLR
jgi:hypothetical protein